MNQNECEIASGMRCSDCLKGVHQTCFGTCQCVICDGLWDAMTDEEALAKAKQSPNF